MDEGTRDSLTDALDLNAMPSDQEHGCDLASDGNDGSREEKSRFVLFHYHLFKNAGTSTDEILSRNFGRRWQPREFPRQKNAVAVRSFIQEHQDLIAISSHTALLPVPQLDGVHIFPILFLRHPLDRLRSAYDFERKQAVATFGADLAKTHDFDGYLRELFKRPRHRQVRNFQTFRLSHNEPNHCGTELQRAMRALESLPFVGLVEAYEDSILRLKELLRPWVPDFSVSSARKNATRGAEMKLHERLAQIEASLGRDFYLEICAVNCDDLALYEKLKERSGYMQDS